MISTNTNLMYKLRLPTTTTITIFSGILLVYYFLFGSLISENKVAATICFDCPGAKFHLDEAKKAIDSGDLEGAKNHINAAIGLLGNSTTVENSTTK
jgi:hypothetical protein